MNTSGQYANWNPLKKTQFLKDFFIFYILKIHDFEKNYLIQNVIGLEDKSGLDFLNFFTNTLSFSIILHLRLDMLKFQSI